MILVPQGTTQLPPQLSTFAPQVDWLYNFIYWSSVAGFIVIVGLMTYYVWKYRRRPGHKAEPTGHSTAIEVLWTFSPLIFLTFLFVEGFDGYMDGAVAPEDAIEIHVTGRQWAWDFRYPGGKSGEANLLVVPVGEPVELIMSSSDVLHSFYVPAFRVKRDVVPGMYTSLWFEATEEVDETWVFCTEYCGAPSENVMGGGTVQEGMNTNHATMYARIRVVSREEYDEYVSNLGGIPEECENADDPQVCWGERLYTSKTCNTCHSNQPGVVMAGPNWTTTWGATRNFTDGTSAVADATYIRQSIAAPQSQIVQGFESQNMPPFRLEDQEIEALTAYIRSLNPGAE